MATKHISSKEEFDQIISAGKTVLVDFFADWCGPCKMMAPMFEQLSEDYEKKDQVEFVKINVDEVSAVAQEYDIMSIPTLVIFADGKAKDKMVGMQSVEALKQKLNQNMA